MFVLDDYSGDAVVAIRLRTNRNLAVAFAKALRWKPALRHADYVLAQDKGDIRAMIRKIEALTELDRLAEARQTLDQAAKAAALTQHLEEREREQRQRENRQFAKMFSKG